MDKAKALTLPELLGTVPSDARLVLSNEDKREVHIIPVGRHCHSAAAELRRLHEENTSLSAALASSCDEQRHELWESGGIAGCERARVAERQRDALQEANEAFGKRQEWWNEKMLTLEAQRGALLEALRGLLSYANVLEMRLLDADGEHRAMQQARAAIKSVEEGK